MDEGYIKFNIEWINGDPADEKEISEINGIRQRLHTLGFIGSYPDGTGFGNISIRSKGNEFLITGTETGKHPVLDNRHYTRVISYDIEKNLIRCSGPVKASSESMTHAAVYESNKDINCVIHIHNLALWEALIGVVPATPQDTAYGTPKMANEVKLLFKETDVNEKKVFIMLGHEEGIVAFGSNPDEAMSIIKKYI